MTDKELRSGEDSMVQKQAEKAVQERQTRFRRISAITSDIAYSCHTRKDGRFSIDWITGAADRITGYSIEEIRAHGSFRFLVVEEDIPLFEKNVIGLAPGSRGSCELRIRHKNGGIVWISSFAECVAAAKTPGRLLLYGGLAEITERKQAEEKLSVSETRYRRLFEAAKDGVLILEADTGMIIDVNPSLTEMLGFSREEFLEKHIWDLGFFKGIVANEADFLKLQQKEYIRYEDVSLETVGERHINVEFASNLYQVGHVRVIQCSIRGAHLASFPAQNPYPVVEVGIDGVVRYSNPATMATLARLGLDPDAREFLPGTPEELVLLRSQCEQNPQTQELHVGKATFLRVVAAPPGGDSLHIYLVNITERKQAEEALQESRRQLTDIIEFLPDATLAIDKEGRVIIWNKAIEKMTGIPAAEMIGKCDYAYAIPFYGEARPQLMDLVFADHEEIADRYPDITRQGNTVMAEVFCNALHNNEGAWVFAKASPLHDQSGNIIGAIESIRDITERKRAEDKLQVAQLQWSQFLEVSPDPVWIKDASGRYVAATKSYFHFDPSAVGNIIGKTDAECFPPEKATMYVADDRIAIETGASEREFTAVGDDGKLRTFLTKKVILRAPDGSVAGTLGVSRDITERKQAEDKLRVAQLQWSQFLEASPDPMWIKDASGRYVAASKSYFHIDPSAKGNIIGKTDAECFPPEKAAVYVADDGVAIETGVSEGEFITVSDDGKLRTFLTKKVVLRTPDGSVAGTLGVSRDITDRKRAEEESQRERAFFDQLVETAPEGIAITDTQGRVMRVNAEFVRMFGYGVDEAVGQCLDDLVAPPARQEEAKALTRSTVQGGKNLLETVRRRKDGTLVDVSLIGASILVAGKPEAFYAIYRDITERKQAEAQLRQSQKMEAIGELAGGVAHDFNNLLTGILGNIALMRSSLSPADPLLENLNAAETAARQAADLTKGLLTFSRSAVVLPMSMNIADALDATLALLKQSLPATMEIVRDYRQTAWNVLLDQSQLTQILLNLAVNARDAMKGKGTLTFSVRNEVVDEVYVRQYPYAQTGEYVHLSVNDTGPGIPDEIMEHLFEPFHTTKPVGSGTGLGLSVIYGAVKQAGGWITAVSTDGAGKNTPQKHPLDWKNILGGIEQTCSGATFDIYLPRCLEECTKPLTPSPLSENACRGTVLVVEDEPVVRSVAQAFLSKSGCAVLTAVDGASAIDILKDQRANIGLVFLDMTMPGMTTDEVVQAIRVLDPKVPILLNSGYTSNDTVKQMLEAGSVQGFLPKPYELHELMNTVDQLMKRT
jgi:PAS domain S-box-containing protein